ncbi:hypothetical protein HN789_05455 [archaeon]|nr:hypothetical protein [archaeon]MBT4271950.1 hypothetical protein [archaeon]MBT4461788.1 hypothetical protein [archaeon]MBT4858197.1 hypothetical protein [archaeon]MBT6772652.1 hypothetical protein [archaeon]
MVYAFSKLTWIPLINKLLNIETKGLEKLSNKENYLFAMTHRGGLDFILALAKIVPKTNKKLFTIVHNHYYYAAWPISICYDFLKLSTNKTRKKYNDHLLTVIDKLKQGENVLIFPEGGYTHQKKKVLARGYTGVIRLAIKSKKKIIPIGLTGSDDVYKFPIGSKNPFKFNCKRKITMNFGDPFSVEKYFNLNLNKFNKKNKEILRRVTDDLMMQLSKLTNFKYRPDIVVTKSLFDFVRKV